MRHSGTWLVVAGVAVLVLAATVDGFVGRGDGGSAPVRTERAEPREMATAPTPAELALRDLGLAGTITYADEACELRSIALPDLRPRPAPETSSCSFATSPGGAVAAGDSAPSPTGPLHARCNAGAVELRADERTVARAVGCAPAWRPDGTLTAIRDGEVIALRGRPLRAETLLSRGDLRRGIGRPPWALVDPHAREVAWLGDDLAAVVVSDPARERDDVIALFRGRRLLGAPPFPYERLSGLRVSPRGSFVAARIGLAPSGLLVLDRTGELRPIPSRVARAIAWTRDESLSAVATAGGIYVWRTADRGNRFVHVPVQARDLFWR
jgi:hypothetical protein